MTDVKPWQQSQLIGMTEVISRSGNAVDALLFHIGADGSIQAEGRLIRSELGLELGATDVNC